MDLHIHCDQAEVFSYETCEQCSKFNMNKGVTRHYRCKLNSKAVKTKAAFETIWLEKFLIDRGSFPGEHKSNVVIEYIGKRKRHNRATDKEKNNESTG